ncbi:hypothetical protein CQ12_39945 [Bradyrhizobium jicamae]|uniref:Uncharacterized protein n=2 Tax=Bradyrhizobium jicamae TaxID=280332 RepID=A0A0R3LW97_9BRAD|nr:hypothetical protein CQ12_39945 [Bradyrhizobium jicamae]
MNCKGNKLLLIGSIIGLAAAQSAAVEAAGSDAISRLPCSEVSQASVARQAWSGAGAPFGVSLAQWRQDEFAALRGRITECARQSGTDPQITVAHVQRLEDKVLNQNRRAQAAADAEATSRDTERDLLVKVESFTTSDELDAFCSKIPIPPVAAMVRVVMACKARAKEIEYKAAEAERKRQDDERRKQQSERQRLETAQLQERLATLPVDVRKFMTENPGMDQPSFGTDGGPQILISLYSSELAFRVCRERFGGWDASIDEAKRRSSLIEKILVLGFGMPEEKIARTRNGLGMDSGRSEIIERMRADHRIRQSCHEFEGALGLKSSPPLR